GPVPVVNQRNNRSHHVQVPATNHASAKERSDRGQNHWLSVKRGRPSACPAPPECLRQGCLPRPGPRHEPGTSVPRSTHYGPLRRLSHAVLVQELGHVVVAHLVPFLRPDPTVAGPGTCVKKKAPTEVGARLQQCATPYQQDAR